MKGKNKLQLLLEILSDHQWHWGEELAAKVGWRFGAVIKEARCRNFQIETRNEGRKWCYRLKAKA
ncbi:hypothetical protein [Thermoleptolyngbya sp.]